MAINVLDLIKKQIDAQNRSKLNTELTKKNTVAVDNQNESPSVVGGVQISPQWTRGFYTLVRSQDIDLTPQLEPEEFKNYSGSISWQNINSQAVIVNDLPNGSNNMFGLQLYATKTAKLPMTLYSAGGILAVYTKTESATQFTEKFVTVSGGNSFVNIDLNVNAWTTVIITFYSAAQGGQVIFGADYTGVTGWRPLDVTAPSKPTWANTPAQFQIVQGDVKRGKVTLKWQKDTSIDFSGNGIYREAFVNSGQSVANSLPATLVDTVYKIQNEKNKWLVIDNGATINAGDMITFDASGSTGTVQVSRIRTNKPNLVANPIFRNGSTGWVWSATGVLTTDVNSLLSASHMAYNETVANTRRTLTSATINIGGNGTLYYIGVLSSYDMMASRHYGIGGYNIPPSNWTRSGGVSAILATRENFEPLMRVARTTALGSIRSDNNHLYFTTLATYQITCSGSFNQPTEYRVILRSSTGAALFSSATIFAPKGRNSVDINAKPSSSSIGYLEINTLATTGNVGTIDFSRFTIVPIKDRTDHSEFLEVQFYDNSHVACATPRYTKTLKKNNRMSLEYVALGSVEIPSTCQYVKLAYVATIGNNTVYFNRRIFGMFMHDSLITDVTYDVFATQYTLVRINGTIPAGTPDVYFTKAEHIIDRPRQSDDGAIVTWDDYDIDNNSSYTYKLDAYDNSPFKNRSAKTIGQTVQTGDTTAPKIPSNFTLTGYEGGVEYSWANPTATDFRSLRFYADSTLSNLLFEQYGSPSATMRMTELVASGTVNRWAVAVDMWGNTSGSVLATTTALSSSGSDIGFQVLFKSGATIVNQTNGDWYNTAITASMVADTGVAVASYFYSFHIIEIASIVPRFTAWQNFNGSLLINNDYRHVMRMKLKDVNGNYSAIKEFEVNIDRQAPRIIDEHSFWSTSSGGGVGYNALVWDSSQLTDKYDSNAGTSSTFDRSGITFGFIRRSAVTQLTSNPFFSYGQPSGTIDGWNLIDGSNTVNASLYYDEAYYGKSCAKFTLNTTVMGPRFRSDTFKANSGDVLYFMCRVKGSIANCTLNIQITDRNTTSYKNVAASLQTSATWQYIAGTLNVTTSTTYRLNIVPQDTSGANIGDYFLLDQCMCAKGVSMATIAKVPFNTNEYTDYDVIPWKGYLYDIQFRDEAGNFSDRLPFKYSIPVADIRDRYTNILDNSSFERTYRLASGTLQAYGWDNSTYGSTPFVKETPSNINQVVLGNAYNGSHYLEVGDSLAFHKVYQNDLHVLPYTGKPRKYVYSASLRSGTGALESGFIHIVGRDNQKLSIKSKTVTLSGTIGTTWNRFTGTFEVATPSVTNLSFGFISFGGTFQVDACQLEEKNGLPASEYYDTKSITADYLQGNLIRGHMIEGDSIYGHQVRANTITATQIRTNTLTVDLLRLNQSKLYARDNVESRIFPDTTFPTLGYFTFAIATSDQGSREIGFVYSCVRYIGGSGYTLYTGHTSNSLTYGSGAKSQDTPLGAYYWDYPILCRSYPAATTDSNLMIVFRDPVGIPPGIALQPYLTRKKIGTGGRELNVVDDSWSTPAILATVGNSDQATIKHDSATGSFLMSLGYSIRVGTVYSTWRSAALATRWNFKFVTSGGTVTRTIPKVFATWLYSNDVEFAPGGGTIFVTWAYYSKPTIYIAGYDRNLNVVVPTTQIETFSGEDVGVDNLLTADKKRAVYHPSISKAIDNTYILTYQLGGGQFIYYKVLDNDAPGTINVNLGRDQDVALMKSSHGPFDLPATPNAPKSRSIRGYNDSVLVYNSGVLRTIEDSFGDKYSLGGYAIFVTKALATLSFEDFFSRLT